MMRRRSTVRRRIAPTHRGPRPVAARALRRSLSKRARKRRPPAGRYRRRRRPSWRPTARGRRWLRRRRPRPISIYAPLWSAAPSWRTSGPLEDLPLSNRAQASLRRLGLLRGLWQTRWQEAPPAFIAFVNRHHGIAGIQWLVREYFGGTYHRATARMAMRLLSRLAPEPVDAAARIAFQPLSIFAPDGALVTSVGVLADGELFSFRPWRRLYPRVLRRQLRRDQALYQPQRIRWVFDSRLLRSSRRQIVSQVRQTLPRTEVKRIIVVI